MLNKYLIGSSIIALGASSTMTVVEISSSMNDTKITFDERIFSSEDDVIDYMFSSGFLAVEKENVIGDLPNSYSNYDLGTLNKGGLPNYEPANISFAWRMANGMLTHDIESAKETYFNEGISNILYSDGYGNDFLTQGDAVISAKQNITNTFNPYIELPELDSDGFYNERNIKYNPFNKTDVMKLRENIDINKIMGRNGEGNLGGFSINGGESDKDFSTTILLNDLDRQDFLWHTLEEDEQKFSTGSKLVGTNTENENLFIKYIVNDDKKKEGWRTQEHLYGDMWVDKNEENYLTNYYTGNYRWHNGFRITSDTIDSSVIDSEVKALISNPEDTFNPILTSSEDGKINYKFNYDGDPSDIPSFTSFNDSIDTNEHEIIAKKSALSSISRTLKTNTSTFSDVFNMFIEDIDIEIVSSSVSLEFAGEDSHPNESWYLNTTYYDEWNWVYPNNYFRINSFNKPKLYQNPESYKLGFNNIPEWARSYLVNTINDDDDDSSPSKITLDYGGQSIFEVEKNNETGLYDLLPVTNFMNNFIDNLDTLNNTLYIKENIYYDYSEDPRIGSIDALNNYYKQASNLSDSFDDELKLNFDDILYLENYSYSNQLLTNVSKFNPSLSSGTSPTTFITSEANYKIQSELFVPIPIAKYVFYDLNGKKIDYSEDAYDSFELMKRNIFRNIDVPKSDEYVIFIKMGLYNKLRIISTPFTQ